MQARISNLRKDIWAEDILLGVNHLDMEKVKKAMSNG